MKVGAEDAIVLGVDAAQVHAKPGHGAAAVCEEDKVGGAGEPWSVEIGIWSVERRGWFSAEKADGGGYVLVLFDVALEVKRSVRP